MNTDFNKLKRALVEKKVADSSQFLDNIFYNLSMLSYDKQSIEALVNKYAEDVSTFNKNIREELQEKHQVNVKEFSSVVNILEIEVGTYFLMSKNIKDFIQVANNILDSLAQFVNYCLIYPRHSVERVDFGFLYSIDRNDKVKSRLSNSTCRNIEVEFDKISRHSVFNYLRKANNRIKHIKDIDINMGFSLFDDNTINEINSFTKNGEAFSKVGINDKCTEIYNFIEECIDNISSAIIIDLETVSLKQRFNIININGQATKCKDKEFEKLTLKDLDFLVAYVEFEEDEDKIPDQLELMYTNIDNNGKIDLFNYSYELILVKCKGKFIGYAEAIEPLKKDIISYREYKIIIDNGKKFCEYLGENKIMKFYPNACQGEIKQLL